MSKSAKSVKMIEATEVTKTELPKKLPIGVSEHGTVQMTFKAKTTTEKCRYSSNGKKIIVGDRKFDAKTGKDLSMPAKVDSEKKQLFATIAPKTYKRDDAATMKALESHRAMKLEAQQRYLAKSK